MIILTKLIFAVLLVWLAYLLFLSVVWLVIRTIKAGLHRIFG